MNELNKFRIEKHKEALEAFSKAERKSSRLMRKLRHGNDKFPRKASEWIVWKEVSCPRTKHNVTGQTFSASNFFLASSFCFRFFSCS